MSAAAPEIYSFANPEQLAGTLAAAIAAFLRQGLATRKQASLVVSGGSTPGPLFLGLRQMELAWNKVIITLADERWVGPKHEASNERLVRFLLLLDKAGQASFVPLKNRAATAWKGEEECCRALARIPRPFDVVVLGMGIDGHTASLLPGAARLPLALDPGTGQDCLAITHSQDTFERMTLTLPALLHARQIILHFTGRDKRQVLAQAMGDGPVEAMPVRAILRQRQTPVHIYWSP
ncbi:MAG TPA: 6-phosphogluconolactonase [Desulfobulbaceae bacterium]|nr:6-phosphogluconolactonase [Desulfobulbaceae bacterium]